MSNKNRENTYDVSSYTEKEILDILDLNDPTDRELEAKIIFMINKYNSIPGKSGEQLTKFFTDIYNYFFDNNSDEENDNDETHENIEFSITEGFQTNDTSNNQISQIEDKSKQRVDIIQKSYQNDSQKKDTEQNTMTQTQNIGFIKPLDFAPDQLNPLLNQTIKRIISIDSQYRDDKTSMSTEFTFNLSSPLKDVVSLKLYSVHIPYSWYTISKSYGSNFIYLKGSSPGLFNNPSQDILIDISAGNYNAQELVNSMNASISNKKLIYSDISFGNTYFSYNPNTTLASINIDVTKQFNENSYYLQFENFTSPNKIDLSRNDSIPSFLGFNSQTYHLNTINSSKVFPTYDPNNLTEIDNVPAYIVDSTNNYFTVIKYIGNYNSVTESIDNFNQNSLIELEFNIVLSGLDIGGQYSRTDIYNEVKAQIANNKYLSDESDIERINTSDPSDLNYPYSYFQLKIKPNRYTTKNVSNSKILVKFPNDNIIWLGLNSCFKFNNVINEINNLTAETQAIPQTINYSVVGTPKILLTCSSENFVSKLNDITINIQSSPVNNPYSIQQYVSAINNGIVNATNITPFLNGPTTTSYNYSYNPYIIPNFSYSYVDDNDLLNLFLKVNKIFDQSTYRLDLTDSYLYNILNIGNSFNGLIKLTENDSVNIKGYIKNNKLTITSGTMPRMNNNVIFPKISFDMSGTIYGEPETYGNIYLKKGDDYYIDASVNMNWSSLNGRTYTVTDTTYVLTGNTFSVIEPYGNLYVPSNAIDVSSNNFNIPGSYLNISKNILTVPSDISNIYFNNKDFAINGNNLNINSSDWIVMGNNWSINNNNLWTVSGNIFATSRNYWDISNSNFSLSSNTIPFNNITLSGELLELNGNSFDVFGNQINLIHNTNNIYWNITTTDFSYSNPSFSTTTQHINTTPSPNNPLVLTNNNIKLFTNIDLSSNNFQLTGNSFHSIGEFNEYNFSTSSDLLSIFDNSYIMIGNSITSYNINSFDLNPTSIILPNHYFKITGTIPVASSTSPFIIDKPTYNLYGNKLSISDLSFNIEGGNVVLKSKSLSLVYNNYLNNNSINLIKDDIIVNGNIMYINSDDNNVTSMDIRGNGWDVSCNYISLFNPGSVPNIYHNYTLTSNLVFKGNNISIPNNKTQITYNSQIASVTVFEQVICNNIKLTSTTIGMDINIPNSIINTTSSPTISVTGTDLSNNIGSNFIIDVSYIEINNDTNLFNYKANIFTYSIVNRITFDYFGIWSISGENMILENPGTSISIQYTDGQINNGRKISIGSGLLTYNNNIFTINDRNFSLINGSIINYISGFNMIFFTNNNYNINVGSFIINGNVITIDNQLNNSKIYLTGIGFNIIGNTITTPTDNYFTITSPNTDLVYNLTARDIKINGNNLSITNNISSITGEVYGEPNNTVHLICDVSMVVTNIENLYGNRASILGLITTESNTITISADTSSYLYYSLQPSISTIIIEGNLTNLIENRLFVNGNINIINDSNYITSFSTSDYKLSNILLKSQSFIVNNNDNNNLNISGSTINAIYSDNTLSDTQNESIYFNNYGNNVIIDSNNFWNMNSKNITVYDQSFQFLETQFTMSGENFIIPGNKLNIIGNSLDISGTNFTTSQNKIIFNTEPLSSNVVSYNTVVKNIYSETLPQYTNNVSISINPDGSTKWTGTENNGFNISSGLNLLNTNTISTTGESFSITPDGNNNFIIKSNSMNSFLGISADILNLKNGGLLTFLGHTYSLKSSLINLGSESNPYDFSINVVYKKDYLSLTNIKSTSLLSSTAYVIPKDAVILKIYPRFPSTIPIFGNENDAGYIVTNNTGNNIICNTINDLQTNLIILLQNFTDSTGQNILSGSSISLFLNTTDINSVKVDATLNLVLTKSLKNKDYAIEFANFINVENDVIETWQNNFFIDPSMVDMSYSLINTNTNILNNSLKNQMIVKGSRAIETINIDLIENVNNSITFVAYENGTVSNDVNISVPVYDSTGRQILYSRDGLIKTINTLLSKTIASGTAFSVVTNENNIPYVQLRSNINLIYRPKDYHLVFYDTISFAKCYVGATSVKNTTWDTTVGWILGFREYSEYILSSNLIENGMSFITGDTGVCTNLFNYFLLCIDDYTQNHLNDGLITITGSDKNIPLPSYANRTNFSCDPVSGQLTYNNTSLTDYSKLTQNQVYSITQIANNKNSNVSNLTRGISSKNFGLGPFVQDVFGLIPMKTAGLQPGSAYIEFGGTLQNQERVYFGPVNIHRMTVKLVTDRGDVVDLNNVNWSFSLLCEQLYKQRPSKE